MVLLLPIDWLIAQQLTKLLLPVPQLHFPVHAGGSSCPWDWSESLPGLRATLLVSCFHLALRRYSKVPLSLFCVDNLSWSASNVSLLIAGNEVTS